MAGSSVLGVAFGLALAAAAPVAPTQADVARDVVTSITRQLEERYPLPEVSAAWSKTVKARQKAGAYDHLEGKALAAAINKDLQTRHRDLHLAVRYEPALFEQMTGGGSSAPPEPSKASPIHGVAEVTVDADTSTLLVRNRGGWKAEDATFDAFAGAMSIGRSATHVVIDLRNCPGGNGAIGRFLAAYFFPAGRSQFYLDGYFRDGHRMQEWTADKVPGPTLPDAKLYVLIGKGTASACEGFAYAMQQMKRATLIGDTSAGAGIAVSSRPAAHGIVLHLPFKMIVGPNSERGWEGVGVVPDVQAGSEDAVEVARRIIREDLSRPS